MRADVYSRAQAESLTPELNQAIISITVPGKPAAIRMVNEWAGILRLEFHDVTSPEDGLIPFDEVMAEGISDFVNKHAHAGHDFVIHCDAGVSRSVAVGVFIRDVYSAELTLHACATAFGANNLVLRTLMRKHWEEHYAQKECPACVGGFPLEEDRAPCCGRKRS